MNYSNYLKVPLSCNIPISLINLPNTHFLGHLYRAVRHSSNWPKQFVHRQNIKKKSQNLSPATNSSVLRNIKAPSPAPDNYHSFDPGLVIPHTSNIRKHQPEWQATAYSTADEYNLENLLTGFNKIKLYYRSNNHQIHKMKSFDSGYKLPEYVPMSLRNLNEDREQTSAAIVGYSKLSSDDEPNVIPGLVEVLHVIGSYKVTSEDREIYFFRNGSVVFWNVDELERRNVLQFLKNYSQGSEVNSQTVEETSDSLPFTFTEGNTKLQGRKLLFNVSSSNHVERYTFSNALATSVKLAVWEAAIDAESDCIDNLTGKELTYGEMKSKLEELRILQHRVILSSDLLDTPDYYWDREVLERLYDRTTRYLNIRKRTEVLNTKLELCVRFYEERRNDYNTELGNKSNEHGHRLEKIIILLIAVEVMIAVFYH